MKKLQMVRKTISRYAGRTGLLLKKNSPEILMTVGVIGVIGSTVMACRATLKAEEVMDIAKEKFDNIHEAKKLIGQKSYLSDSEGKKVEYTEQDYKRDLLVAYVQTGVDFVKLYGPAFTLGVASIGCLLGAHGIMRKRNIALMAAYKAIEQNFATYRKRVIDEFGTEKDRYYRTGVHAETVTVIETDENGKKVKVRKTVETVNPNEVSIYARFFDEGCYNWSKTPEHNLHFLKCQQNYANDLLQARGHVFLNEVYDSLGIPRSQAGQLVGWVKGHGDNYVDFGIFDVADEAKRNFVNGYERNILLDFNVDGVVYDMI